MRRGGPGSGIGGGGPKGAGARGIGSYRAVVIGASSGGLDALTVLLSALPEDFPAPVLAVLHREPRDLSDFAAFFRSRCRIPTIEPCDKERVAGGAVYVAPANYHLLVERDLTLSLSTEEPVHWSRPSIDVLFESAARAWGRHVVGVLLTGGNADGVEGLLAIRAAGGLTLVQDPSTAECPAMPRAAIRAGAAQRVLSLEEMAKLLVGIGREPQGDGTPQVPGLEEVQS